MPSSYVLNLVNLLPSLKPNPIKVGVYPFVSVQHTVCIPVVGNYNPVIAFVVCRMFPYTYGLHILTSSNFIFFLTKESYHILLENVVT